MIRTALLTSLLTLAVPAAAQDMQEPAAGPQPSAAPPASGPQPQAEPLQTGMQPSTAQPRPATPDEVGALVTSEFPNRDGDHDGSLDQEEFSAWMAELAARAPGQGSVATNGDLQARITSAFSASDTDRSGSISPSEMTALLSRGR